MVRIVERRGGICCCKYKFFIWNLQTFSLKSTYQAMFFIKKE